MRTFAALGLILVPLCACATAARSTAPEAAAVEVADLVSAVSSALAEAEPALEACGVALKSATLTVEAEASTDETLGLSLVAVSAEAGKTSDRTLEVSVALDVSSLQPAATKGDSYQSLRKAIEGIANALTRRRAGGAPVAFDTLTVEIELTVTSKLEGGLVVEALSALELEPELTRSRKRSQTLSITLIPRTE